MARKVTVKKKEAPASGAQREHAAESARELLVRTVQALMKQKDSKDFADALRAQMLDKLKDLKLETLQTVHEGATFTATRVQSSSTVLDEERILSQLTPAVRKQVTKTVLDQDRLMEMINAGDVSPEVLEGASTQVPRAEYLRIGEKRSKA